MGSIPAGLSSDLKHTVNLRATHVELEEGLEWPISV